VNALRNKWPLLTAQSVSVQDLTDDVRALIESITLDDLCRADADEGGPTERREVLCDAREREVNHRPSS
jgi:hypothetical protein